MKQCVKDLSEYREIAARAVRNERIFRICSTTRLALVCAELRLRGFVEVIVIPRQSVYNQLTPMQLCQEAANGNEYEKALISKLVGADLVPNYVWLSAQSQYKFFNGSRHVSRIEFLQSNFTIKHHMVRLSREISAKTGSLWHPRAFEIVTDADIETFEEEFQWTVITSFIRLLNENLQISDDKSGLSTEAIDIAVSCLQTGFLNGFELVNRAYQQYLAGDVKFFGRALTRVMYRSKLREATEKINKRWPDKCIDGYKNVWIVKPSLSNRGEGILVSNKKEEILAYINHDEREYVIQKYIENPLLIFKAKFDIRQYFVITIDDTFFCGWAHPRCHIKLASQAFTLDSFEEAAHVTNITVQKKYLDTSSEELPKNHVWSLEDLEGFFEIRKRPGFFWRRIFPSIKQTLKEICEASVRNIELRSGRFELFGCDWMITDESQVLLLEINRGPCLENLTPKSTAALDVVLQDFMKSKRDIFYSITVKFNQK